MLDKNKIKNSLTDEQVIFLMKLLGATQYNDRGDYIQFPSICHNEYESDAGFNLSYYKESKKFYCFSECHSMDIYQVIRNRWELMGNMESKSFESILFWVMNNSGLDLDNHKYHFESPIKPGDYDNITEEVVLAEKNENVLDLFTHFYPVEWLNDGISEKSMDDYEILFDEVTNSIIIPHRDVHGRLVGIRKRALNDEDIKYGKYRPIYVEGFNYSHALGYNLYGLNKVKDNIKRRGRVYIAEGEKSVLQAETLYDNENLVVAACGSRINRWQVHLLMKYAQPKEIVIAFDKGLDYDKIEKLCRRYSGYCRFSYIYDHFNKMKDKESPFDRPDLLEELINTRVKI